MDSQERTTDICYHQHGRTFRRLKEEEIMYLVWMMGIVDGVVGTVFVLYLWWILRELVKR